MLTEQLVAIVVVGVAIMSMMRHMKGESIMFKQDGSYENMSPFKHDVFKQITLDLFPLLVYGLTSDGQLWNQRDPLNSKVGKMAVGLVTYIVYYNLVEPYVVNRFQKF